MAKLTRTELAIALLTLLFLAFLGGYYLGRNDPTTTVLQPDRMQPQNGSVVSNDSVQSETPTEAAPAAPASGGARSDGPINLNTATEEELCTLPGIGTVLAKRILAYREANDGFASIEEITDVSGIGEKKFDAIRGLISVE